MGTVLGVDGEGVSFVPCVHTLSILKEKLMPLKTGVPNFLLLTVLTFPFDFFFFYIGVTPNTYTRGHLFSYHSGRAKFGCDINLLTS